MNIAELLKGISKMVLANIIVFAVFEDIAQSCLQAKVFACK